MYKKALKLLRKSWHAHTIFWAKDETRESKLRNCVVLSPHPDDETIGMGSTIARKTANKTRVVIAVATDGRYSQNSNVIDEQELIALRKKEFLEAVKHLGVPESDTTFLNEIDTKINVPRLKAKFESFLDSLDFKPDELLTTSWYDGHVDHQMCAKIVKEIADERNIKARFCPMYWWADGPSRFHRENHSFINRQFGKILDLKHAFLERAYAVRTEEFNAQRKKALKEYQSQLTKKDGNPDWDILCEHWLSSFERDKEIYIKL